MQTFIDDRLDENAVIEFFQPIKNMKLKTFTDIKKSSKVSVKDKIVPMRADSNLFGQLALIMQTGNLDLKEVFEYPLGPFPWSLSGVMGLLRKTNKSSLMHWLENDVDSEESVEGRFATVFDGMAIIQSVNPNGKTFGDLLKQLLKTVMSLGKDSARIDVVFDVYRAESIKNAERIRRCTSNILFQKILPNQQIKQWHAFLSCSVNKEALINFRFEDWEKMSLDLLKEKVLFVAFEEKCYCFSHHGKVEVQELESNHEEAYNRMLLHLQHADNNTFNKFVVHTPDTNVIVLCLGHLSSINGDIYIKTGVKDNARVINLQKIKEKSEIIADEMECRIDDLLKSFIG